MPLPSRRARKRVNYAQLCDERPVLTSDSDDDFQQSPNEMSGKKAPALSRKKRPNLEKAKNIEPTASIAAGDLPSEDHIKTCEQPGRGDCKTTKKERLSREERLFQRDIDAAIKLSSPSPKPVSQGDTDPYSAPGPSDVVHRMPSMSITMEMAAVSIPLHQSDSCLIPDATGNCASNHKVENRIKNISTLKRKENWALGQAKSSNQHPGVSPGLGGVNIVSSSPAVLRIGLSRKGRIAKPLHSHVQGIF